MDRIQIKFSKCVMFWDLITTCVYSVTCLMEIIMAQFELLFDCLYIARSTTSTKECSKEERVSTVALHFMYQRSLASLGCGNGTCSPLSH